MKICFVFCAFLLVGICEGASIADVCPQPLAYVEYYDIIEDKPHSVVLMYIQPVNVNFTNGWTAALKLDKAVAQNDMKILCDNCNKTSVKDEKSFMTFTGDVMALDDADGFFTMKLRFMNFNGIDRNHFIQFMAIFEGKDVDVTCIKKNKKIENPEKKDRANLILIGSSKSLKPEATFGNEVFGAEFLESENYFTDNQGCQYLEGAAWKSPQLSLKPSSTLWDARVNINDYGDLIDWRIKLVFDTEIDNIQLYRNDIKAFVRENTSNKLWIVRGEEKMAQLRDISFRLRVKLPQDSNIPNFVVFLCNNGIKPGNDYIIPDNVFQEGSGSLV